MSGAKCIRGGDESEILCPRCHQPCHALLEWKIKDYKILDSENNWVLKKGEREVGCVECMKSRILYFEIES